MSRSIRPSLAQALVILFLVTLSQPARATGAAPANLPPLVRSERGGAWSAASTWEGGHVPAAGERVQIRTGHAVVYDVPPAAATPVRSIHVAGVLSFARDRDTRLDVGLIRIQAGDDATETGFDCPAHARDEDSNAARPALEVGTADRPIEAGHTALIRLTWFAGLDQDSCPAIICCGGRMDFHGSPMPRTWVKLGSTLKPGDVEVKLAEPVTGWHVGDKLILTSTHRQNKSNKTFKPSVKDAPETEERMIRAVNGAALTLDSPVKFEHLAFHTEQGDFAGEVANLSRNVVVESADPLRARGHTMYHRNSAGSIGYAEFRHLGKENLLGRYSLHFHLCGDTMRGSSVVGASIWDSGNRWLTIHGTNYLVVRDCVGYQSVGHGFYFEDGTEEYNVMDRNLAVQAFIGKPLPGQVFPFDKNDGAGFWWSNSLNTFVNNVAAECDEHGYFFQAEPTANGAQADGGYPGASKAAAKAAGSATFDLALSVAQPDGERRKTDIRTLPFIRFENNESHTQRRHAFNLGGSSPFGTGVDGVGADAGHPFLVRHTKLWDVHWAFHPVTPSVLVDGMTIYNADYAIWRPVYGLQAYRGVSMTLIKVKDEFQPQGTKPVEAEFPKPLQPVNDLPPATVITSAGREAGKLIVRGVTEAKATVARVRVNGAEAKPLGPDLTRWEVALDVPADGAITLTATSEDSAGNAEKRPHVLKMNLAP